MKVKESPYIVVSGRFDGHGHGFAVGFNSRTAAYYFATFCLLGFGDVLEWWQFENRYPNYKNNEP